VGGESGTYFEEERCINGFGGGNLKKQTTWKAYA
jgi:hypothetical protein